MAEKLNIALFGNPTGGDETFPSVVALIDALAPLCRGIEVERDFYRRLQRSENSLPGVTAVERPSAATDIIISIGGDGTFLRAVRWEGEGRIPVAGLNGGHLGYLTGWTLDEIPEFVKALVEEDYRVERRSMIKVETASLPAKGWPYALNEVAVLKESSATMIGVRAEISGNYLADYDGDGLIVATPTGSTGYNLSVGGPVLEPELPAWILSPVAAHSLTMRPLVVSEESELRLVAHSRTGRVLLSLDGRSIVIPEDEEVRLVKAPFTMPIVRRRVVTFADTLREKLYWGLGSRSR